MRLAVTFTALACEFYGLCLLPASSLIGKFQETIAGCGVKHNEIVPLQGSFDFNFASLLSALILA
jgi:hypothetical protein